MNSVKMEIEGFNFEGYIGKIIVDEFYKLRKEFDSYFSDSPCDVELRFDTEEVLLWNVIKNIRGHLSREKIRDILIDFENIRYGQYCDACFEGKFVKSKTGYVFKVNKLFIRIHVDRLNDFIINHLDNMDIAIENLKISLRHEFGHIIDFIGYHGMSKDELTKDGNRRNKEIEDWYESIKGKKRSLDDIRRYHQLEVEATANKNVDLDIEDIIKSEVECEALDHTKLKTTITITSEYEPLKEDDSDGERK